MIWFLKESRIPKLLVILLLMGLFHFQKLKYGQYEKKGFVYKASFAKGTDVQFSLVGENHEESSVLITSLTNDTCFDVKIPSYHTKESEDVLLHGLENLSINTITTNNLQSGIYLINDTIPFVISDSDNKADIVVVYPYANNLIETPFSNKSVKSQQYVYTSLYRNNFIDQVSLDASLFFKELSAKYSINYIADTDLENANKIKGAKLLIFYQNLLFGSTEMKNNLLSFIEGGGDVLLASEEFMNNVFTVDFDTNVLTLNKKAKSQGMISQERFAESLWEIEGVYINDLIGLSYSNGGKAKQNRGYKVRKESKLFSELEIENVPVLGENYMGLKVRSVNGVFECNSSVICDAKVHAYIDTEFNGKKTVSGIIEVQVFENGGTILSLGTDKWFFHKNYGISKEIQKITNEAISYLLND